jgi:hypothetical protein
MYAPERERPLMQVKSIETKCQPEWWCVQILFASCKTNIRNEIENNTESVFSVELI